MIKIEAMQALFSPDRHERQNWIALVLTEKLENIARFKRHTFLRPTSTEVVSGRQKQPISTLPLRSLLCILILYILQWVYTTLLPALPIPPPLAV